MKIEVGKKYIVKFNGFEREWVPVCVDKSGSGWGLINGVMVCNSAGSSNIREWTPDPGEGYDLLVYGQPNFDVVQKGDQYYDDCKWINSILAGSEPSQKFFYRRPKAKKLVPFTWEDRDFLRGKVIISKDKIAKMELSIFCEYKGGFMINDDGAIGLLRDGWTFEDGTPCGKWV